MSRHTNITRGMQAILQAEGRIQKRLYAVIREAEKAIDEMVPYDTATEFFAAIQDYDRTPDITAKNGRLVLVFSDYDSKTGDYVVNRKRDVDLTRLVGHIADSYQDSAAYQNQVAEQFERCAKILRQAAIENKQP